MKAEASSPFLRAIIVDDDPVWTQIFQKMLAASPTVKVLKVINSVENIEQELAGLAPDVVFLDMMLPGRAGLDLIGIFAKNTIVVAVSSSSEYAVISYEHDVLDYLLKPVTKHRLEHTLQKLLLHKAEPKLSYPKSAISQIFVKVDSQYVKVNTVDILYVEADKNYCIIKTVQQDYRTHVGINQMEEHLPKDRFMRIHKSYVVKLEHIDVVQNGMLVIRNHAIPVSKSYQKELEQRLSLVQ